MSIGMAMAKNSYQNVNCKQIFKKKLLLCLLYSLLPFDTNPIAVYCLLHLKNILLMSDSS